MLQIRAFLLCFLAFPVLAQQWLGILDSTRAIDWTQAGVVGGIPSGSWSNCVTSQCNTVNGGTVTASSVQAAINSAPTNTVVRIPAGSFSMSTFISMKSNVVLRGAGAGSTTLTFATNAFGGGCFLGGAVICFTLDGSTYNNSSNSAPGASNAATWASGFAQGATSISLASVGTTGISNGGYLYLDQANDVTITSGLFICDLTTPACSIEGGSPGRTISGVNHSQLQIVKVVSGCSSPCVGSGPFTVTITPGLYGTNWSSGKTPGAWFPSTEIVNAGVENLTINNQTGMGDNGETINFMNAANCWASGIASQFGGRAHIWMVTAAHITVQNSYFYQTQDAQSQSYGVEEDLSSDNLVVNNIFQQVTAPLISGSQFGDTYAYNFGINNYQTVSANCMYPVEITHDAAAEYNLWEGNVFANVEGDIVHGSTGLNTVFRNVFTGYELGKSCTTIAVFFDPYNRFENVIGNVLGTPGKTATYQNDPSQEFAVYALGQAHSTVGADSVVATTLMRWGNYDNVTGAIRWCGNSSDTGWSTTCSSTSEVPTGLSTYANAVPTKGDTGSGQAAMPASFIYSSTPSWWPSGKAWPAIGPEVTNGTLGQCAGGTYASLFAAASGQCTGGSLSAHVNGGHANSIPAMDCYLSILGGPPDGSGSVLAFDASTCYSGSPSVAAGSVIQNSYMSKSVFR